MRDLAFEPGAIGAYFTERLGEPVTVSKLGQSFPGISRETWFVTADVAGREEGFVLRVDPPEGGSCPYPMRREWDVYQALYGTEVPVAEPLWYDEGGDFAEGRALMVRRLVDGSPTIPDLGEPGPQGDALRERVAYECVENLARVHMLDWKAAGLDSFLPAPPDAASCFRTEFDLWKGYWDEGQPFADPVFDEALNWLSESIPTDTPRISLVKGNNGVGEEIWRDGRIVAMSDWELACLGDGICDLFWSQGTVRLVGFDKALRHYEHCTGQSVSPERLAYASLFAWVKQYVCAVVFWYGHYHAGRTRRIYAQSAMTYTAATRYRLGRCIGKSLAEAWDIVKEGEKSMYTNVGGRAK